jgi:DNA primase
MSALNKELIKSVPITAYLANKNIMPLKQQGGQWLYHSPLRTERSPSFLVNPQKNLFNDLGSIGGDVIRLVQLLEKCDFLTACNILCELSNQPATELNLSLSPKIESNNTKKIEVIAIKTLSDSRLIDYVRNRGIDLDLARKYLKEVSHLCNGTIYKNVGFATDFLEYEIKYLSNGKPKTLCTGKKSVTTFDVQGSKLINLFEGCFDFLSALQYFRFTEPRNTTVVLNSTSLLKRTLPYLKTFKKVNCYLDNDDTGTKKLNEIRQEDIMISDFSNIYKGYKDFNEYLIKIPKDTVFKQCE